METTAKSQDIQGRAAIENYWLTTFPKILDESAKTFFDAGSPRLQAKYTEELVSWWFKAQGYGNRIDPDAYALRFFDVLDAALES